MGESLRNVKTVHLDVKACQPTDHCLASYLMTEYVEKGDLFNFINFNGWLNEEEAMWYFQ
jgi:hypothetical protein